jgi:hypothetical protein
MSTEVSYHPEKIVEHEEDRLGQEVEPAKVHGEVEARDAKPLGVPIEEVHFLRAREQVIREFDRAPRRDRPTRAQIVDLVLVTGPRVRMHEPRREQFPLVGHKSDKPVLVGDPEPASGRLLGNRPLFLQLVVVDLAQRIVENA